MRKVLHLDLKLDGRGAHAQVAKPLEDVTSCFGKLGTEHVRLVESGRSEFRIFARKEA